MPESQIYLAPPAALTFTHTQIKSIPMDAPGVVTLLPAPGAGRAYLLVNSVFVLDNSAGAYGTGIDANWYVAYGTSNVIVASRYVSMQTILQSAGRHWIELGSAAYSNNPIPAPAFDDLLVGNRWLVSDVENQPLLLVDNQNPSAYTGGHANNTLKATVFYAVIDV